MQCKRTVTRIGLQFPRWSRVERKFSVRIDGIMLSGQRKGIWTSEEEGTLKAAVQTHSGKNWDAITALVPGRTKSQCRHRWHQVKNSVVTNGSSCCVVPSKSKTSVEVALPLSK
jgi:hypothetical protein